MITSVIVLFLLGAFAIVLLFVFAKPEEEVKIGYTLLYALVGILLLVGIGMIGFTGLGMDKVPPRLIGLLVFLLFLMLGIWHAFLLYNKKNYSTQSRLLKTFFIGSFAAAILALIGLFLWRNEIDANWYKIKYIGAIFAFPVPLLVWKAALTYLNRPILDRPKTCYPQRGYNHPQLDFRHTVPLHLRFAPAPSDKIGSFRKRIPSKDPLEAAVFAFWQSLPENDNVQVLYAGRTEQEPAFCWEFRVRRYTFWPFSRIVDAKRTAEQLEIAPKSILTIKRIYQ